MIRYRLSVPILLASLATFLGCGHIKERAYSGWNREEWQMSERVIKELDIKRGETIADVGAGGGYFTLLFAKSVGKEGRVLAVDIDPDMIDILREKIASENLENVTVIQATKKDSRLPDHAVDLIFLCNSYHSIYNRVDYFRDMKAKLVRNGKLAVVDLKPDGAFGLFGHHGTSHETIVSELVQAGYRLDARYDFLPEQNFQIFSVEE